MEPAEERDDDTPERYPHWQSSFLIGTHIGVDGPRFRSAYTDLRASRHPVEAFEVIGQANQRPFAADLLFAAQTEPTKAHHCLDDPKDWFDGMVAPSIQGLSLLGA